MRSAAIRLRWNRKHVAGEDRWFNYGDPLSIHALACATNELYHGIGRGKGMPTLIQTWKKSLKGKARILANKSPNFAKHANTDPNGVDILKVEYAELLILDSIMCLEKMFRKRTPLMTCFFVRFAFENPALTEHINLRGGKRDVRTLLLSKVSRRIAWSSLNRELPALIAAIAGR
jgi:hypothetical protein